MIKKGIVIIFIIFFTLTSVYMVSAGEEKLSNAVLRFHVIANSDDPEDQMLKLAVKDEIVKMMKNEFQGIEDVSEAKKIAVQKIPEIRTVAENTIKESGCNYPVNVSVGEYMFPVKSYGNLIFPQGKYQAVRVIIGEGKGKNWWCVLFPPLCLVSTSDKGLSLDSPQEMEISFKCLELLPAGVKWSITGLKP